MNAIGRKMTTSDSVVAMTASDFASALDRRPTAQFFLYVTEDVLQDHDRIVDHDPDRSVMASRVMLLSVKPMTPSA
jgi:hypothetical protein